MRAAVLASFVQAKPAVLQEGAGKAVLQYDLLEAAAEKNRFSLWQRYRSLADAKAHMAYPHTQKLMGAILPALVGAYNQTDYSFVA